MCLEQCFNSINNIDASEITTLKLTVAIQSLQFTDRHIVIFVRTKKDVESYMSQCLDISKNIGYDISAFNNNRLMLNGYQYSIIFESVGDKYSDPFSEFEFVSLI